jgi:spore coat polysaccharide biosynthesis protein SpsF
MESAVVLQARMGSHRLPGKVMADIAGRPLIAHCVERLRRSGLPVVIATTTNAEDDVLETEAEALGAEIVRGSEEDVLKRFAQVVSQYELVDLVRATADNPAVDIDAVRRSLDLLRRAHVDYVVEHRLPYGAAVEAVTASAILRADELATEPYDREHVTSLIRRDGRFLSLDALAPGHLRHAELRFTVDTPKDLAFMRRLIGAAEAAMNAPVPLFALIALASRHDWDVDGTETRSDAR